MSEGDIDESLYSRQLYSMGKEAMQKLRNKKILITGINGLGLEIAKNIILSGVYQVSLHDDETVSYMDLSSMFYCNEMDCGQNRAEAVYESLCELNEYVKVKLFKEKLTKESIKEFDVIVLCDAKSNELISNLNEWCREGDQKFIMTSTRGLFGMIFCDFGDDFEVKDVTGAVPEPSEISMIMDGESEGIVYVKGDKGHGLCDESYVKFYDVQGMTELNDREPFLISVNDYMSFYIGDISEYEKHVMNTGTVKEIMMPKKMKFYPFSVFQTRYPKWDEISISDYSKMKRPSIIHLCFLVANDFLVKYGELPKPWCVEDGNKFVKLFDEYVDKFKPNKDPVDYDVVKLFSYGCRGTLNPIHAALGGIVAQEVLKASSQQFTPINQFYYTDFLECLPTDWQSNLDQSNDINEQFQPMNSRYDGQIVLFGRDFQKKLAEQNLFVIGAGAIGCEMVKNLAMIGVACDTKGLVTLTDMDHIERSNLNRQFLFRPWNIGHPKSVVAASVAKKMNPSMQIDVHENRLGVETEQVYTNAFFCGLDCILNALDNVEARQYVASRVEMNSKPPIIDSGTLGTQASQQIIIPFMSKTYTGRQGNNDAIPICTIKNFPYQIEHTIQWAKDLFYTHFTTIPKSAELFIENKNEFKEHVNKLNPYQKFENVSQLLAFFETLPNNIDDCVMWAMSEWDKHFAKNIQLILHNFPEGHLTAEGMPFWSGNKRVPKLEHFSLEKSHHTDFVLFATKLRCNLFKIAIKKSDDEILELASQYKFEDFKPSCNEKVAAEDKDLEKLLDKALLQKRMNQLFEMDVSQTRMGSINPQEFEKDDDSNFHIDFITSASNMRAFNYSIPQADRFKTKKIAGRIIPAIVTSTSVITGQVCMELIKLVQGHKEIRKFRDSFLNLASPVFTMTIPEKPRTYEVKLPGHDSPTKYSKWDKFDVRGDVSLQEFCEVIKKDFNLDITCVAYQTGILMDSWFDESDMDVLRKMKITEIIRDKLKLPIPENENMISLTIGLCDEDGEDIEKLPEVRYRF